MGKAKILEAHGEGRYTIQVVEARERAESAKRQAEARIVERQDRIRDLDDRIAVAQSRVNRAAEEQDSAIRDFQAGGSGLTQSDLSDLAKDVVEAAGDRDRLITEKRAAEMLMASDRATVARVDALPPLREMQAWCADYTDDLEGEVATAEVPGEIGQIVIKPSFAGNAWSPVEDGAMQPALAATPASTFYNLAMLPGWQKWRPTFRTATIDSIDGNTCDITLDAAHSSQQGLGVNASRGYSGVPIMYMDCDGDAFDVGDAVLVAFSGDHQNPVVVGFKEGPKVCCQPGVLGVSPSSGDPWMVLDEFGNEAITGGPSTKWRIIDGDGNITHSGGVTGRPDGSYRLAGLPEEVPTSLQEVVSEVRYARDDSRWEGDVMGVLSFPTRPEFAGGRWYRMDVYVFTSGDVSRSSWYNDSIDSGGAPVLPDFLPPYSEVAYYKDGWEGIFQKGGAIEYRKDGEQLFLEKGCMTGSGIKWPDDNRSAARSGHSIPERGAAP